MFFRWSKFPAIRLTLVFICGIALHILLPAHWQVALTFWFISLFIVVLFIWLRRIWLKKIALYFPGISVVILLTSSAYLLTYAYTDILFQKHFSKNISKESYLVAMVEKPPVVKEKTIRVILSVKEISNSVGELKTTKGKLLATFLKGEKSNTLEYGSVILLPSKFTEIEAPKNPEQFDYKEFMSFQNVYHQVFLKESDWQILDFNAGNIFFSGIYKLRAALFSQLEKYVHTKDELGVASALLLGYKDFITPEVTQAFAASGALHVLSVSGLHVGMVYVVLSRFLFFLKRNHRTRLFQTFLIVILIWIYACLTGLSPSVLRASAMFSMMALGRQFSKRPNMFNIIGASALLLMIFNPYIMTEVGFKLSYLAVIGIVYLHPIIVKWFSFKNKLLQSTWEITAVSIAAQATTFPLGLYYFHQFPNLFVVSNLVVIPAGWLLINSGILLFLLSPIELLQTMVGNVFYWVALLLNKFVFFLEEIPYSILDGISISVVEMILIYAALAILASLIVVVKARYFIALLGIIFILVALNVYESVLQQKQENVFFYSVKGKQAVAVVQGTTAYIDFDSTLLNNKSAMLFNIQHHWWKIGIKDYRPIAKYANFKTMENGYVVEAKNKRFVVLNSAFDKSKKRTSKLEVDAVLLSKNAKIYLNQVLENFTTKTVIADAGNSFYAIKKWKEKAQAQAVDFVDGTEKAIVW